MRTISPPSALDNLAADHLFTSVIAPLTSTVGFDAAINFSGVSSSEHRDKVDRFECCKHFGARLHRLDRTTWPFQSAVTDASPFKPTTRRSHAARAPASSLT